MTSTILKSGIPVKRNSAEFENKFFFISATKQQRTKSRNSDKEDSGLSGVRVPPVGDMAGRAEGIVESLHGHFHHLLEGAVV